MRLRASNDNDFVKFEITDNGSGVEPAQLTRVFEKPWTTDHQGTGLGLFIARSIVVAHGGEIEMQSSPGQGTTVVFRIPSLLEVKAPGSSSVGPVAACGKAPSARSASSPPQQRQKSSTVPGTVPKLSTAASRRAAQAARLDDAADEAYRATLAAALTSLADALAGTPGSDPFAIADVRRAAQGLRGSAANAPAKTE